MDAHGYIKCGTCGSKFRLDYRHTFGAVDDSIMCPTCSKTLFAYREAKTYFIAETVEVRRDHEQSGQSSSK